MATMASEVKAVAIHLAFEEIVIAIQSVRTIANRCWRKKIISEQIYKEVLRQHLSVDTAKRILLKAVEASICEEAAYFDDFLHIISNELPPQVANDLISKIVYHLEETLERTNLEQCTEDKQNEKGAVANTEPTQVSVDSNFLAGKSEHTLKSSTLCTSRKRISSPIKQGTRTGLHRHSFPQSAEVEPIQATEDTPSLMTSSLQQRQEMLRRLEEEKFAQYDTLQAEANNKVLMDEKESLKRQLEQQSVDYKHSCDEKKKIEKELSDKQIEVDQLLAEREQKVASHRLHLEQLKNQVAEKEKTQYKLKVRRRELKQKIKKITKAYDTKISQCQSEIQALQEELATSKSIVHDHESIIAEQQLEIRKLSGNVIMLQDKLKKKCTELDVFRLQDMEFRRNVWALLVFFVVLAIFVEIIGKVVLVIGLFSPLF